MNTVYVDVLLGLNMFVDYFIIIAAGKISHTKYKFSRAVLSSIFSSFCSIVVLLPEMNWSVSILFRLFVSSGSVMIAFGYGSFKRLLTRVLAFFSVSFAYAGIMTAMYFLFKPSGVIINNGVVYYNVSPMILLVSTVVCYLAFMLLKRYFAHDRDMSKIYEVEAELCGEKVTFSAFLDTGNKLCDLFTDDPVMIASYKDVQKIIPKDSRKTFENCFGCNTYIDDGTLGTKFRLIPYSVVGDKGLLPAFKPDSVLINKREINNCVIAVSTDEFQDGYSAIFGENMFDNISERTHIKNASVFQKHIH